MFLSEISSSGTVNYASLVHIVKPDDLSQTPHGSSYKESLFTLATLLTKNIGNTNMSLESNRIVSLVYNLNFDGSGNIKVGDLGTPGAKFHIKSTSGIAFKIDGVAIANILSVSNDSTFRINTDDFAINKASGVNMFKIFNDDISFFGQELRINKLFQPFGSNDLTIYSSGGGGKSINIGADFSSTTNVNYFNIIYSHAGLTKRALNIVNSSNVLNLMKDGGAVNIPTQIGNAGLTSGTLYRDSGANIMANGDLQIGIKT